MESIDIIKRLAEQVCSNEAPASNTNKLVGSLLKRMAAYIAEQAHGPVNGYVFCDSLSELPSGDLSDKEKRTGYVVGENIYFYVGIGGDTNNGEYRNGGSFRGTKGDDGLSAYDIWHSLPENEDKNLDNFWAFLTADKGYRKKAVLRLPSGSTVVDQTVATSQGLTYQNHLDVSISSGISFTIAIANGTGLFSNDKVTLQLYNGNTRVLGKDVDLPYSEDFTASDNITQIRISRSSQGVVDDGDLTVVVTINDGGGNIEEDTIYAYPSAEGEWSQAVYEDGEWIVLATNPGNLSDLLSALGEMEMDLSGIEENVSSLNSKMSSLETSITYDTWTEGYYITRTQAVNHNQYWKYMQIALNDAETARIVSKFDGNEAYCFLNDSNGNHLKTWNNDVIDEVVDLENYPTATTLIVCCRLAYEGFVTLAKGKYATKAKAIALANRITDIESRINYVYPLLVFPEKYIHFSVDDSHSVWEYLIDHPNMQSIFDGGKLRDYKTLHDATGLKITLNLFGCNATVANAGNETYKLEDIPNTWAAEFQENKDWLKFSHHSYYTDQEYGSNITGHSLLQDYTYFKTQVIRFTGSADCIDTQIRLGYFSCPSMVEALSIHGIENGVTLYSTADDSRVSNMYLNASAIAAINSKGMLYDTDNEIMFIRSMYRLDESAGRSGLIDMMKQHKSCNKLVETFCHETKFSASAMATLFGQLLEMGYEPAFLSDIIGK